MTSTWLHQLLRNLKTQTCRRQRECRPRYRVGRCEQLETRRLLAFDINLLPSAEYSAIPGAEGAAERAAGVLESLFSDDITINIELGIRDDLLPEVGSVAGTEIEFVDYGPVRDALIADSKADADYAGRALPTANNFSVDLPPGFALEDNNGADPNEIDVAAPRSIRKAIGLVAPHSTVVDGAVFLNDTADFDTDNSDGIEAGTADLESLLLHEFAHVLGFTSVVNDIDFSVELGVGGRTEPHVLDLFRFDADDAANPVSFVDFAKADRSLEPTANAVTNLLTEQVPMSTGLFNGDGFRTGHWQDETVGGQYYGLLDPLDDFSQVRTLTPTDILGLDILGYDYIPDTATPTVINIVANGDTIDPPDLAKGPQPTSWLTQRSQLKNIEVNFSRPMVVTANDLRLTNLGVHAANDPNVVVPLNSNHIQLNGNQLVISFAQGELDDGVYQLEILDSATDGNGAALDGDADGNEGGDHVLVGSSANGLFQIESDYNADTGVSVFDFTTFSYWFGSVVGVAPDYADPSGDLGVSVFDFTSFSNAFGTSITFGPGIAATPMPTALNNSVSSEGEQQHEQIVLSQPVAFNQPVAIRRIDDWNAADAESDEPERRLEILDNFSTPESYFRGSMIADL